MADRGVDQLESEYGFARDNSLRTPRNEQAHGAWQSFAFAIVNADRLGDPKAKVFKDSHAHAFEFTYGMTWEAAAKEEAKRHGRCDEGNEEMEG